MVSGNDHDNKTDTHDTGPADPQQREPDADSIATDSPAPKEIGGRPGPDPARYGDWEKQGRCIDF